MPDKTAPGVEVSIKFWRRGKTYVLEQALVAGSTVPFPVSQLFGRGCPGPGTIGSVSEWLKITGQSVWTEVFSASAF